MRKKDLIKLALIGLTSTACLAAQDSDELDQTLSMYRRSCRGQKNRCRGYRRGADGHFGARTNKSSCRGSSNYRRNSRNDDNGYRGNEYYEENGYNDDDNGYKGENSSCSGKSGCPGPNGCGGSQSRSSQNRNKNNAKYGNGQCKDPKKCSKNSSMHQKYDSKKADKNAEKRYESSF